VAAAADDELQAATEVQTEPLQRNSDSSKLTQSPGSQVPHPVLEAEDMQLTITVLQH